MMGIIPAAGAGQRIQPLGCSKELLPVGSRSVDGVQRPKAVAEYLGHADPGFMRAKSSGRRTTTTVPSALPGLTQVPESVVAGWVAGAGNEPNFRNSDSRMCNGISIFAQRARSSLRRAMIVLNLSCPFPFSAAATSSRWTRK